jgi:hypothetical protein
MGKKVCLVLSALALSILLSPTQGGLYKWVDENGHVQYSDNVPPEQVQKAHTELSDRGVRIDQVERAKTPEEAKKEAELERLRRKKEALLAQQKEADEVLLRTFRSEDDLKMARDGKMTSVDVLIDVTKGNVRRQQNALVSLRSKAANLERTGKPVPAHLSDGIAQREQAIRAAYGTIIQQETKKDAIFAKFEEDLARFRQLKNLPARVTETRAEQTRPILHNIVPCPNAETCDRLWVKAADYVAEHVTTPVQTSSATILITAPPQTEEDISLVLSRIDDPNGTGASLFLDLQCHRSVRGREMCEGEKAQGVLKGFRKAILSPESADTK